MQAITAEVHEAGLAMAERDGLSLYDVMIGDVMIGASAVQAGCDIVWSEDMRHGMKLGERVRIVDPFRWAV